MIVSIATKILPRAQPGGEVANFSVSSQVCLHIHTGVRLKDAPSDMLSIIRRSTVAKTLVVLEIRL